MDSMERLKLLTYKSVFQIPLHFGSTLFSLGIRYLHNVIIIIGNYHSRFKNHYHYIPICSYFFTWPAQIFQICTLYYHIFWILSRSLKNLNLLCSIETSNKNIQTYFETLYFVIFPEFRVDPLKTSTFLINLAKYPNTSLSRHFLIFIAKDMRS